MDYRILVLSTIFVVFSCCLSDDAGMKTVQTLQTTQTTATTSIPTTLNLDYADPLGQSYFDSSCTWVYGEDGVDFIDETPEELQLYENESFTYAEFYLRGLGEKKTFKAHLYDSQRKYEGYPFANYNEFELGEGDFTNFTLKIVTPVDDSTMVFAIVAKRQCT
ncbi:MAG: hypothetical protein ABIH11_04280 [Candidatus Altiarchaeota archaeon]